MHFILDVELKMATKLLNLVRGLKESHRPMVIKKIFFFFSLSLKIVYHLK